VQEQLAILRHLIQHHGLTSVLQEGVTAEDYEDYQLRLDLLAGEEEDKDFGLTDDRRVVLLRVGAAGRLLIRHELQSVLPLDDAKLLEQARPVFSEEGTRFDPRA
jgi:hypothetical protein